MHSQLDLSPYHPTVKRIITLLEAQQAWYETFQHQPVRTSQEAAAIRTGYTLSQGAKALLIKVKKPFTEPFFAMMVLPGDRRLANDKVKAVLGAKEFRFATEAEVIQLTDGVLPGGVPPFGNLFGLPVYVDQSLLTNDKIIFNAGDKAFSIAMNTSDYLSLVQPSQVDIV